MREKVSKGLTGKSTVSGATHHVGDGDGRDDLSEIDGEALVEAAPALARIRLLDDVEEARVLLRVAGRAGSLQPGPDDVDR